MTTLRQKRETYRRLWLLCEIYKPQWKAALERARAQTGIDSPKATKPRKPRSRRPQELLPLRLMTIWRNQGMPAEEIAAKVKEMNEARLTLPTCQVDAP